MKILFLSDVPLQNPKSGAEQVLNQQVAGLSQKFVDVSVISRRTGKSFIVDYNKIGGIKEACYSLRTENYFRLIYSILKYPPKLYDQFRNGGPFSVIICHQPFTCLPLLLKRKIRNSAIIYVFHSPNHEEYLLSNDNKNGYRNIFWAQLRRSIERYCLKSSQKKMVLSHYMKQKMMRIHKISEDQIIVNPGGADLGWFKPHINRKELKKELHFPDRKIHLLTVRNLELRMGLDNLLKAMCILKKKSGSLHLIIGGEGPERENLENRLVEYSLTNDVTIIGFIPSDLLPKYYSAADFFVIPTMYLEGFGLVTTESMACGTPVIGTPVGGTREILSKFEPRLLFQSSTPEAIAEGITMSIETYFNDKKKYEQLRIKCREHAEKNYSWQRHVDQLSSTIYELVNKDELIN